jgi:hypothetical protein
MKCLSASIVILAGVLSLTLSGFMAQEGAQLFIGFVGVVVTCLGFLVWGWLLMDDLIPGRRPNAQTEIVSAEQG